MVHILVYKDDLLSKESENPKNSLLLFETLGALQRFSQTSDEFCPTQSSYAFQAMWVRLQAVRRCGRPCLRHQHQSWLLSYAQAQASLPEALEERVHVLGGRPAPG